MEVKKEHLKNTDYTWTKYGKFDTRTFGDLDDTEFAPNESHQMIFMIEKIGSYYDSLDQKRIH